MIEIDTTIRRVPTSTPMIPIYTFHLVSVPREPIVKITPRGKSVLSEEEAIAILFPTANSKKMLQEATRRQHEIIKGKIRSSDLNPIRGWRMIREMDQTQLSEATGIRQPNLSRMERLGANSSISSLRKIAKALNISVKELLP
jgi:DNA-binding Xre family transcriptional regulator